MTRLQWAWVIVSLHVAVSMVPMPAHAERKDSYADKIEQEKKTLEKLRGTIVEKRKKADEAEKKRVSELRRSGLVLDDEGLIEAWEHGEDKRYIPVKFKGGKPSPDSVASLERLGALARHIRRSLGAMAGQLHDGAIAADPLFRSQQENACLNCEYYDACLFSDGENGESCRYLPKLTENKAWGLMEEEDE